MSKPWDNEPTPIIDAVAVNRWHASNGKPMQTPMIEDHLISTARDLERRMRAAERLLADKRQITIQYQDWYRDADAHLEAARKDDEQ